MPVTTGLVSIRPWSADEWVTVRASETPDVYRVVYDNRDLFDVQATGQPQLIDEIIKAWRRTFPEGR